ncbi:MAG TPA: non-canonical purine NTP pyrophosphatase, partial [Allosphingosinicella sp.]
MRKLGAGKLVIASHNKGKVREITALLGPYGIEPVSAADLDLPEPEETGNSFVDNAELKARLAADLSGLPALADDSGLCVDGLGGAPGIFSARWAGEGKDFGLAMERVHAE